MDKYIFIIAAACTLVFSDTLHPKTRLIRPIGNADGKTRWDEELISWIPSKAVSAPGKDFAGRLRGRQTHNEGFLGADSRDRTDYIDKSIQLTFSPGLEADEPVEAVIETLIIADKEFGDTFQHNIIKILDYFTVLFWDLNLRFKTLPSSKISFRITAIVLPTTPEEQPFIEEARNQAGLVDPSIVADKVSNWIYETMSNPLEFDTVLVVTNAKMVGPFWGTAPFRGACAADDNSRPVGIAVVSHVGPWQSISTTAHQIAHMLGASDDDDFEDFDPTGLPHYIMRSGLLEPEYFFSPWTDASIAEFLRSDQAACLRRIDGVSFLRPDFSSSLAPTMQEQCELNMGPGAYIEESYTANCKWMYCQRKGEDGRISTRMISPPDNTPCLGGRCFRGRCRREGVLIKNVATGQCLYVPNPFFHSLGLRMVECPDVGTPLDRFSFLQVANGYLLATPWSNWLSTENGDRCVHIGSEVMTDRCNTGNPWQVWGIIGVSRNHVMLSHRTTKRCMKPEGIKVFAYDCDINDMYMRWELI